MASNVLPLFWNLASTSKETRLSASADLVSSLEGLQQSFLAGRADGEPSSEDDDAEDGEHNGDIIGEDGGDEESGMEVDGDEENEEAGNDPHAAKLEKTLIVANAEDVVYSIRRLIRGLGSSRESSRLGYAVALAELLSRIPSVLASQVISLLINNSPYSHGMKGTDERDAMFARLFGLTAIIQSGALFASGAGSANDFRDVMAQIVAVGQAKGWLRESAWWTLLEATERLLASKVEWKGEAVDDLVAKVFGEQGWTQEKVALALILERGRPDLNWKSLLSPAFKHTPLLASANLAALGRTLKGTDSEEDDASVVSTSTGSWKPQLHFVWTIILDLYYPQQLERSGYPAGHAPFQDFFRVLVDESLFSHTSSSERKFWGFQVLERALPIVPSDLVPQLFTLNFMRCWMNNLSSPDRYLHKVAVQVARRVQDVVKSNPSVGFALLATLVGKHGWPDFDRVTKTKTVETIMGSLNAKGVTEYVEYLEKVITTTEEEHDSDALAMENRRIWALDQLLAICRNGSLPREDEWIRSNLDFLLVHGFFVIRKVDKKSQLQAMHIAPKPCLSEATSAACRARFFSCIIEITTASTSQRDSSIHSIRQGCDSSGNLWLQHSLEVISSLQSDPKHAEMILDAAEEIRSARDQALETIVNLGKIPKEQARVARGVEILLSLILLQTFDENDDALDMLEEVNSAARRMFDMPTIDASSFSSDSAEPSPVDSILDILITFLDMASSDLRNLASLVFGMVASSFTSSSIEHLVAQLEQSVASAASGEEEEDAASSPEEGNNDDEQPEEGTAGDSPSFDDIEDDEDEDENPPVDPAFRQRVAEALGVSGVAVDDETESDASDGDSEVWDDEQILKVDEQLAEAFRQQANTSKRSGLKHLQTESLHFKNRILDFFDIYARRQAQNPLVLDIILPLLRLVRASGSSEGDLANKAAGILRTRFGRAKEVPYTAEALTASATLMSIHELARTAPSADFSSLCSACSLFVSRTIDASAKSSENASAVDVYRATLADFMSRKSSSVHPAFLTDYMRRFPVQAWPLRTDLCGYVARGAGLNTYHQTQAYGMLQILTSQLGSIAKAVGASEVTDYVQRVSGDVFETLEAAAGSETEWYAARLKEVVKFALQLARTSRSVLSDHAASEIWDTQKLAEVTAKVKEGERTKEMKSVHGLLQQLAAILTSKGEKKEKTTQKRTGTDDMDVDGTALTKGRSPQLGVKSAPNGYAHSNGKKAKTDKQGRVSETVSVDPTGEKKVNGHIGDLPKEKKPKSTEGLTMACKSRTDVEKEDTHRKKHKSSIRAS